jgi:hypothetical protein
VREGLIYKILRRQFLSAMVELSEKIVGEELIENTASNEAAASIRACTRRLAASSALLAMFPSTFSF